MVDFQEIIDFDKEVLLALNGSDSIFWDGFMWSYTGTLIWIPLVIVLLVLIYKNKGLKSTLLILIMLALVITIADQVSSGFFKPYFQRFRPTQDPEIMYLVDIVNDYRGGKYGFISSHAANSFGIFTFTALLIKNRRFTYCMLCWAIINCFSRIYLGVHYLGDIFFGTIVGVMSGFLVYRLYLFLNKKIIAKYNHSYSQSYSQGGYLISDINIILSVLFASFFLILLMGMFLNI